MVALFVASYALIILCVGAAHQVMYGGAHRVPYMSPWVSYLIMGALWPVTVPVTVLVFTLRALDVNI